MKLIASIHRPIAGQPAKHRLTLGGKNYHDNTGDLSHILVGAGCTSSSHRGIFSAEVTFYRDSAQVTVNFDSPLNFRNYSDAQAFLDEVKKRIDMVQAAFNEKYPVHDSEAELVIGEEASEAELEVIPVSTVPQNIFA